ncbi:MAG: hypothetical protein ACI3YJ_11420 [Prevotella sp.]
MANDKLNKELVSRMMDDAAWKELSKDFPWTEQLLEKYMNYVDWKEISRNNDVVWTKSLLEKFKHRLDWHELTSNSSTLLNYYFRYRYTTIVKGKQCIWL